MNVFDIKKSRTSDKKRTMEMRNADTQVFLVEMAVVLRILMLGNHHDFLLADCCSHCSIAIKHEAHFIIDDILYILFVNSFVK